MNQEAYLAGRIVIVDDNESYVTALKKILTSKGYNATEGFTVPGSALESLTTAAPDLLILDMHMPGMNGIELLMELKKAGAMDDPFPVLILTGDRDPGLRETALALGTLDYLAKPFRTAEVLLRVKNLICMRMLHREVRQHAEDLETKVRERTRQLDDANRDTVHRLARAAEFRDDETGRHIQRVGEMASALATEMGLDEGLPGYLLFAAQLHDIGKIGISDSVLLKPGKLTEEEFDLIKTHTTVGQQILTGSPSFLVQLAAEIALSHHERWDGAGYPRGLAGEDIPLCGRITAVADVYDALTHRRPYKPAWTHAQALAEITKQSAKMFDPNVVDAFATLADEKRLPANLMGGE